MKAIILMGNLGSGKSTIAKLINPPAPQYADSSLVIGNFRSQNRTEHEARQLLLDAVHRWRPSISGAPRLFIYETTTANLIHPKVMKAITDKFGDIIRVKLGVSQATSEQRCILRNTPSPFGTSHAESFTAIAAYLQREWSDLYFDSEALTPQQIKTGIITYLNANPIA